MERNRWVTGLLVVSLCLNLFAGIQYARGGWEAYRAEKEIVQELRFVPEHIDTLLQGQRVYSTQLNGPFEKMLRTDALLEVAGQNSQSLQMKRDSFAEGLGAIRDMMVAPHDLTPVELLRLKEVRSAVQAIIDELV